MLVASGLAQGATSESISITNLKETKHAKVYPPADGVRLICEEIAALKKAGGLSLQFPEATAPLSPSLDKFSPPLREAAREVEALLVPFLEASKRMKPTIGFQANKESFSNLATDLVEQTRPVKTEEFFAYKWAGWCGTGSEALYEQRAIWVWLSLLREKRYSEAVGAALFLEDSGFVGAELYEAQREFLNLCGLDAPKIGLGMIVLSNGERANVRDTMFAWELLASGAGKREVDWLKELTSNRRSHRSSVRLLGEWVSPFHRESGFGAPKVTPPLSKPLREEILRFLEEKNEEFGFEATEELVNHFSGTKWFEAKPLLRRLVEHPSEKISKKACDVLRGMGETVEVPPKKRVVFQLLNNGAPLRNTKIDLGFEGGGTSSSGEMMHTDDRGEIMVEQSRFQDPGWKIERVCFSSADSENVEMPLFSMNFPAPQGKDGFAERQTVEIQTKALELQFPSTPFITEEERGKMEVAIELNSADGYRSVAFKVIGVKERLRFPVVEGKRLKVTVGGPKLALYTREIDASKEDVVRVSLERGSDVTYGLSQPKGWGYIERALTRDGEVWDQHRHFVYRYGEKPKWRGLPKGDYVLRFSSSRELREKNPDFAAKSEFEALEKSFRIDDDSTEQIDLGEIILR